MIPQRIQLSRAKGWKMPPNTVKVDRTTKWGNPFPVEIDHPWKDAAWSVLQFSFWIDRLETFAGKPSPPMCCWLSQTLKAVRHDRPRRVAD